MKFVTSSYIKDESDIAFNCKYCGMSHNLAEFTNKYAVAFNKKEIDFLKVIFSADAIELFKVKEYTNGQKDFKSVKWINNTKMHVTIEEKILNIGVVK